MLQVSDSMAGVYNLALCLDGSYQEVIASKSRDVQVNAWRI